MSLSYSFFSQNMDLNWNSVISNNDENSGVFWEDLSWISNTNQVKIKPDTEQFLVQGLQLLAFNDSLQGDKSLQEAIKKLNHP